MPKIFGLIGRKLSHSFSKAFFERKFRDLGLSDHQYHLFELDQIESFEKVISSQNDLKGLNVTVPYKESVMPYLHEIDDLSKRLGAVNTIAIKEDGSLWGYNSDYYGFKNSLQEWFDEFDEEINISALVFGTGGASKAVVAVLEDLSISFKVVSRRPGAAHYTYEGLMESPDLIIKSKLWVNTTPVGMYPFENDKPAVDYNQLSKGHMLYDLVYNPEKTGFLKEGLKKGCRIKNGLQMLQLQAEKSWEIWTSN